MAKQQKFFTVSTIIFGSLKEAEEQMKTWQERDGLQQGSMVFEIVNVYKPALKLVKDNKILEKKLAKLKKKGGVK